MKGTMERDGGTMFKGWRWRNCWNIAVCRTSAKGKRKIWCTRKQTLNKAVMKEMPAHFHTEKKEISFGGSATAATQCNAEVLSCRFRFFWAPHRPDTRYPTRERKREERESKRKKGSSINSRSAGSRRLLFLLRTTNPRVAYQPPRLFSTLYSHPELLAPRRLPRRFPAPLVLHPLQFARAWKRYLKIKSAILVKGKNSIAFVTDHLYHQREDRWLLIKINVTDTSSNDPYLDKFSSEKCSRIRYFSTNFEILRFYETSEPYFWPNKSVPWLVYSLRDANSSWRTTRMTNSIRI